MPFFGNVNYVPMTWLRRMGDAGKLSSSAFPVRLHEWDEHRINAISQNYGISKAAAVRLLVHNALETMPTSKATA